MIIELKIPSPGESITEVEIASWFVATGDMVSKDQEIGEIESEKATLPLIAEEGGKVDLRAEVGDTVEVGTVVCTIDTTVAASAKKESRQASSAKEKEGTVPEKPEAKQEAGEPSGAPEKTGKDAGNEVKETVKNDLDDSAETKESHKEIRSTPVARKMMEEHDLDVDAIIKGLRRITSSDVRAVLEGRSAAASPLASEETTREVQRTKMSQLRKKITERLVAVKNQTAMLTTFNEADMSTIMALRKTYQDRFVEKHGIKLGFMSFFTKAVTEALKQFPNVNSYLDGEEILTPAYYDIGIAVQTDKGLLVPVLRNTETMSLAEIEKQILDLATRARKNRISMNEMSGGTFTITNGGIFGSMLSTPILNPPQSAILGMHNILERPVAIDGKVEIRPMMYIALSYDHRVIDGRDSVGFLKAVKEYIENPVSMLFRGSPENTLLDL
jgi:2-oxoglutarate dehydrogenase E2 component (dihydrolipoamide succinyltransferase)